MMYCLFWYPHFLHSDRPQHRVSHDKVQSNDIVLIVLEGVLEIISEQKINNNLINFLLFLNLPNYSDSWFVS